MSDLSTIQQTSAQKRAETAETALISCGACNDYLFKSIGFFKDTAETAIEGTKAAINSGEKGVELGKRTIRQYEAAKGMDEAKTVVKQTNLELQDIESEFNNIYSSVSDLQPNMDVRNNIANSQYYNYKEIQKKADEASAAAKKAADEAAAAAKKAADEAAAKKAAKKKKQNITRDTTKGIDNAASNTTKAIGNVARNTTKAIGSVARNTTKAIGKVFKKVKNPFKKKKKKKKKKGFKGQREGAAFRGCDRKSNMGYNCIPDYRGPNKRWDNSNNIWEDDVLNANDYNIYDKYINTFNEANRNLDYSLTNQFMNRCSAINDYDGIKTWAESLLENNDNLHNKRIDISYNGTDWNYTIDFYRATDDSDGSFVAIEGTNTPTTGTYSIDNNLSLIHI